MTSHLSALARFCAILLAILPAAVWSGSLTPPPGAPAPTMKTLALVEPRTAITAGMLPLTIPGPGSYYVAEDILFSTNDTNGITVASGNVTIDLNGFTLTGSSGGTGVGVYSADSNSVVVKNGVVAHWGGEGVYLNGANCRVENVTATDCLGAGISAGDASQVEGCLAASNGSTGISVGTAGQISNCIATSNGQAGINALYKSAVRGCTAFDNGGAGVQVLDQCVVSDCAATSNTTGGFSGAWEDQFSRCSATANGLDGFSASRATVADCLASNNLEDGFDMTHSTISSCQAYRNTQMGFRIDYCNLSGSRADANFVNGINAGRTCLIRENDSDHNGDSGLNNGAGIYLAGIENRVEANNLAGNYGSGIASAIGFNIVIGNTSSAHTVTNYSLHGNDRYGAIVLLTAGSFTSTNAWANFEF